MPPKQTNSAFRSRAPAKASAKTSRPRQVTASDLDASEGSVDVEEIPSSDDNGVDEEDDGEAQAATIPPDLLTRLLHQFFEKQGTRITKDANAAVARYVDVFVREAIARAAAEKQGGFLEVGLPC